MQYTTHYNLNLPEGSDIVNPLIQDNPNYTAIDAALYANKLRAIGTATEVKSGTVHALTRSDTDIPVFRFVATSDYNTGDTFTVDGTSVTALLPDGTTPKNKAYVINASVVAILDGSRLTFVGVDGEIEASDVEYDNSGSGLTASNTQAAIDEIMQILPEHNIIFDQTYTAWNGTKSISGIPFNYSSYNAHLVIYMGDYPANDSGLWIILSSPIAGQDRIIPIDTQFMSMASANVRTGSVVLNQTSGNADAGRLVVIGLC